MSKLRRERSVLTPTKDGILSALVAPTGAIPNGRLAPTTVPRGRPKLGRPSGTVTQLRPPVLGFTCDTCGFPSYGWKSMSAHVDETAHLTYTAIRNEPI